MYERGDPELLHVERAMRRRQYVHDRCLRSDFAHVHERGDPELLHVDRSM
jgi:hypothetical protein